MKNKTDINCGHEHQDLKQKQSKDSGKPKHKRVRKDNWFINISLTQRALKQRAKRLYGINPSELEIILAIKKITSDTGTYCKVNDIKIFLVGHTVYSIWNFIPELINKGLIVNRGKERTFYIDLTDKGHEIADNLQLFIIDHINKLNDELEFGKLKKKLKRLKF